MLDWKAIGSIYDYIRCISEFFEKQYLKCVCCYIIMLYIIVAPPIFVCPVFSCINEIMVIVLYCFDYDVTFTSMVNLEDAASHRHKQK